MPSRTAARLATSLVTLLALTAVSLATPVPGKERARDERRSQEDARFAAEMAKKGLWREALFRWKRALAVRPEEPGLHNNVGVALEALGKLDEAMEHYERALELAPEGRRRELEANLSLARRAATLARPAEPVESPEIADAPEPDDGAAAETGTTSEEREEGR